MTSLRPLFSLITFLGVLYFSLSAQAQPAAPVMHLAIPAISLDEPVYPVKLIPEVPSWQVLDNHVGWHDLSAPPGNVGNTILNGHSNAYGRVFEGLSRLKEGDRVTIIYEGQVYPYIVRWSFLVQEEGVTTEQRLANGKWIQATPDKRLTLVTCADGTKYRLIVVAFP